LCNERCEIKRSEAGADYFTCFYSSKLVLSADILNDVGSEAEKKRNLVFADLIARRFEKHGPLMYVCDETKGLYEKENKRYLAINVNELMKNYPDWPLDRYLQCLINIYNHGLNNGMPIEKRLTTDPEITNQRLLFCTDYTSQSDFVLVLEQLIRIGYVDVFEHGSYKTVFLTGTGLLKVGEALADRSCKECFVAISFSKENDDIYRSIAKAVSEAGFIPIRIDNVEHNNQIVPEIISHIRRCRFLVSDVTIPNYGAYYESGIARGAGKDIIITCKRSTLDAEEKTTRPHFDIAQQSMVLWDDLDDLYDRLLRRIQATII